MRDQDHEGPNEVFQRSWTLPRKKWEGTERAKTEEANDHYCGTKLVGDSIE